MQRIALTVGVDRYDDPGIDDLHCARRDAEGLGYRLHDNGFEVHARTSEITVDGILQQLHHWGGRLREGGLFLFFFAGHGKTVVRADGSKDHLLLLPTASKRLLARGSLMGGPGLLSLRVLKELTDHWTGVQRLFVVDACRQPLQVAPQRGADAAPAEAPTAGVGVFRDMALDVGPADDARAATSPWAALTSCDDGEMAEELRRYPGGGHGKFTAALIEELVDASRRGQPLTADPDWSDRLHQRMARLGERWGGNGSQRPTFVGQPVRLLAAVPAPASSATAVAAAVGGPGAQELDDRLWRAATVLARTQGARAYLDYLEKAPAAAAHMDEALAVIEALQAAPSPARASAALRGLQPGQVFRDASWAPEMVVVPAGRYLMGSPGTEADRAPDEGPQHEVVITRPFAMGRCVVTFDDYDRYVSATGVVDKPSDAGWGRGKRPVINVSWQDAQAYVAWLNDELNLGPDVYRLPTEAEWEYAARAGTTTPFWWGEEIDTGRANYNGFHTYGRGQQGQNREQTLVADALEPNPWGLYQVHGNVYEWVQDGWSGNYRGAPTDGSERKVSPNDAGRVLRGGSWHDNPGFLRSALRIGIAPGIRNKLFGFRLARTL